MDPWKNGWVDGGLGLGVGELMMMRQQKSEKWRRLISDLYMLGGCSRAEQNRADRYEMK